MTDTSKEFDWAEAEENEHIVQQHVHRVAVYDNPYGDVVIRQERDWHHEEDDPFIVIARSHAIRAAHAILEAAGLGDIEFIRPSDGGYEDVPIRADVVSRPASPEVQGTGSLTRLSLKECRELVAKALRQDPNRSNRAIAVDCSVSDKTVASVRSEIGAEIHEHTAEIRTK